MPSLSQNFSSWVVDTTLTAGGGSPSIRSRRNSHDTIHPAAERTDRRSAPLMSTIARLASPLPHAKVASRTAGSPADAHPAWHTSNLLHDPDRLAMPHHVADVFCIDGAVVDARGQKIRVALWAVCRCSAGPWSPWATLHHARKSTLYGLQTRRDAAEPMHAPTPVEYLILSDRTTVAQRIHSTRHC